MPHSAALLAVLLLAACYQTNTAFDADAMACSMDEQCTSAAAPICAGEICVQCTAQKTDACVEEKPICGTGNTCRACSAHSECGTKACLPTGACAKAGEVAFVAPLDAGGMDNMICSSDMPCTKVSEALRTMRPYVLFSGVSTENVVVDNRSNLTFLAAPRAQLSGLAAGPVIEVKGNSLLRIYDLEITRGLGATGHGIQMNGNGDTAVELRRTKLTANSGTGLQGIAGKIKVTQSMINDNTDGGISLMNASFVIISNFFYSNGGSDRNTGGVALTATFNASNRLEFNSFYKNESQDGIGTAIQCIAGAFTARNNILFGNFTGTNTTQTGGSCAHSFSLVSPGAMPTTGQNNFADDPKFMGGGTADLRLTSTSPALGKADPGSDLTGDASLDIDGQERKSPADIGADELP